MLHSSVGTKTFSSRAALTAMAAFAALFVSAGQAQVPLPDTQTEILAAMRAVAAAGGGKVLVAPGIIDVLDLRVPSNVTLVGSGVLGTPTTTLRLRAKTNGRAIIVGFGTVGNAIENIIVDGNRQNQSPSQYTLVGGKEMLIARAAPLTLACTRCAARYVRVHNSMADGLLVASGNNILLFRTSTTNTGRFGFYIHQSVDGARIYNSQAYNTGMEMRYIGGGAGFGAGGKNVVIRYVETRGTNGDGVAAYSASNLDIQVLDSVFYSPKNHCVHLGGDRAVIARNKCYSPRTVGYYLANDFRPNVIEERNAVGGRILSNYVENAGTEGVKVQWHVADTIVSGNHVNKSFNNNYLVLDSKGVSVTKNIGRFPGNGRKGGDFCHLKIVNSRVAQSGNNFSGYPGAIRPQVC